MATSIVVAGGAAPPAGYPTYPAYGTGYTTGGAPISHAGSLIPQASLGTYLKPGPYGYVTVDWDKFRQASKYDQFLATAPENGASNTSAEGGYIREKVAGAYVELNGTFQIGDNTLRVNGGLRYVHTDQTIGGLVGITDPRNNIDPDGAGPLAPTCPGGTRLQQQPRWQLLSRRSTTSFKPTPAIRTGCHRSAALSASARTPSCALRSRAP